MIQGHSESVSADILFRFLKSLLRPEPRVPLISADEVHLPRFATVFWLIPQRLAKLSQALLAILYCSTNGFCVVALR